jgi:hypothetical protein
MNAQQEQQVWKVFEDRGIADAARKAGAVAYDRYGCLGLLYPVQSKQVPGQKRFKGTKVAKDGPKYAWWPDAAPERPHYYFVNGIKAAIEANNGQLYLAGGEADVWAYSAAGANNVLCLFGESSVPDTFVSDLKALGVVKVVYPYDNDKAGYAAAKKVQDTLDGTGIELVLLKYPGEFGSGYDTNALWIECGFDADKFWNRYRSLEVVNAERDNPEIVWDLEYENWCKDVERAAVSAWGIDEQRHKEWSRRNFSSPTRSDSDPSARWNYETHGFKDFGTGEFYNTHQVAELLGADTWEVFKARLLEDHRSAPLLYQGARPTSSKAKSVKRASLTDKAREEQDEIRVVTSDEAMSTVLDWLDGKVTPDEPILSPYPAMHSLQGMAKLWERRKLIYVIGAAGMGKTAFMETGADNLRKHGLSVIYWGPEWSPQEVQMKAIARYGGPSFDVQRSAHAWERQRVKGIPEDKRYGRPLTADEHEKAYRIGCQILSWPGKAWYIDKARVSLESVGYKIIEIASQARGLGHDPAVFFCDYLQKAKLPGSAGKWDELEMKANVISYSCIEADLAGVIASQVGKNDSRQLRKNTQLDGNSAQGLSDQLCNLYITLNPVFDRDGNRLEKGVIRVEKNSSGYAPASVTVKTALYRHYWSDEITTIDIETEQPAGSFSDRTAKDD